MLLIEMELVKYYPTNKCQITRTNIVRVTFSAAKFISLCASVESVWANVLVIFVSFSHL